MQSMEILQRLEGVDELGEAKALCSVSIQGEIFEQEPEVISSAFTKDAVLQNDLVLSICPKGEYEQFIIGRNGFWSLMAESVEKYCDTIRFLFPREQFGVYEFAEETVEQMIAKVTQEIDAEA